VDYHLASYTCAHVTSGERPVLYVCRDEEGDWQLLCGEDDGDHEDSTLVRVVGIGHLIDADETLREILDLEPLQQAERETSGGVWTRGAFEGIDASS
jgi:hypothetical protein